MKIIKYVGLDVHKKSISVAIADEGSNSEIRSYGKIPNTMTAINKLIRKLVSSGNELRFAYEAGPCGYCLYRNFKQNGYECIVIAPSLIPRKPGERVKTDRRDAETLARLFRANELTSIHVPDSEDEAMRDLVRAREDAKNSEKKAKQILGGFLLRNGFVFTGKTSWSKAHFRWISDIKMDHPAQQITLQEYVNTVTENIKRVQRVEEQIKQLLPRWRWYETVKAIQALRGVSSIVAVTTIAELGDLSRFETAEKLMSYLGLTPSEHSSGETKRKGPITKTGNTHVRRVLVEAAHAYRLPARVSRVLLKRQEGLPKKILDISWKAQVRLCARYRKFVVKGKPKNVTVTAIARELAAFIWAISREVKTI